MNPRVGGLDRHLASLHDDVYQDRPARLERVAQRARQLARVVDPHPGAAERPRQPDEIDAAHLGADRRLQVEVREELAERRVAAVVDDQDGQRQLQVGGGPQRLNEYIDDPSPNRPITGRAPPVASATPTAAGRLWPRPPLAQVKKLCGRSIGR